METDLDSEMRWPEAVTFEEMNQKPPSMILVTLARVMWDDPKERRKWKRALAKAEKAERAKSITAPASTPTTAIALPIPPTK